MQGIEGSPVDGGEVVDGQDGGSEAQVGSLALLHYDIVPASHIRLRRDCQLQYAVNL